MTLLSLDAVSKSYGADANRTAVLKDINLQIREGEFVAIVGFSGSGKTTLISAIAGLIQPDSGSIRLNGKTIEGPGPDRGIVFQSYSLMPWLTVHGNVALAVDQVFRDWPKDRREAHTRKYIDLVGLTPAAHKRPAELSGGMRQRVAVARALAASPDILLLDEPLSALDALTRANLQDEILRIWEQDRKTVILITNDVDEGLLMADRVIPLKPGPDATFGPEFVVNLPRPRERAGMNHDPRFKQLRGEITQYLMGVGMASAAGSADRPVVLPPVRPNTSIDWKLDTTALKPTPETGRRERYLEFTQLTKVYPTPKGPLAVVEDFNLKLRQGEFVSLIGHSGCGKSTVLSMCAGLNAISSGGIILDGKEIDGAGPDRAVVFQAPSLFPWLTAFENVALGVESVYPHAQQSERDDIVEYYLTRVGLADAMGKKASALSNGMKQRVGIARAFALAPKLLLLDEPFGMLDSLTRWELQEVLMEVWGRTKLTALMVTHDVDEAILLADRVVMMTNGPRARVGKVIDIDIPRPRTRKALLEHPDYYSYRESLISFLAECDRH
ncbi:MAG: ATP-binding cassette domain-containing protein [Gammaproteobacteria bacterium]|nr:ATP-binding cassette domain-containing protein [Gammaproteobacteria bacterium]